MLVTAKGDRVWVRVVVKERCVKAKRGRKTDMCGVMVTATGEGRKENY